MTGHKKILIIAGPNGAGKTNFATEFLPNEADCPSFVNADAIAAGLSPFRPSSVEFRASRLMIETIHGYAARGESFAFETTLSGRGHIRWIPLWRERGYHVKFSCRRRNWRSRAFGSAFRREATTCRRRSSVGDSVQDGAILNLSIEIWLTNGSPTIILGVPRSCSRREGTYETAEASKRETT